MTGLVMTPGMGPWSVGWTGQFLVESKLVGEQEIDIDDRGATLEITLTADAQTYPVAIELTEVRALFDFTDPTQAENIVLTAGGRDFAKSPDGTDVLKLDFTPKTISSGQSAKATLKVKTGIFSKTPHVATTNSTPPGIKTVQLAIDYKTAPTATAGPDAATMWLVVAKD